MRESIVKVALIISLLVSPYAFGQVNAVLTGTVADSSGALIPGVEVTAKNINTGITDTRVTNETGNFVFPSLQPGNYTLQAALSGFQTASYNNVVLGQGQQVRLNFQLQVSGGAQNVEVTIAADTLLATTSASVGNVLPDSAVVNLPLASRNVLDLVQTTPGVVTTNNAFNAPTVSFGGTPFSQVNTTRDGLVTNDGRYNNSNGAYSAVYTSPDMVEEIRITANNVDPALGRGSAQVQMRTRAGTNDFHGALFYTNNNSIFTAQPWFSNRDRVPKNYANRNQFGGRLGGPIVKNKAFFFVLIDDQRFFQKVDQLATVFTDTARQGIFRYLTVGATGANGGTGRLNGSTQSTTPSVTPTGQILTADANGNPLFLNSFNLFSDVNDPNRKGIDPIWVSSQYLPRMPSPNDWTIGDGLNTAGFRWRQPNDGLDGATGQSQNTNRNHLTTRFDYQLNPSNKFTYTMSREKNWGVTGQTGLPDYPAGAFGDVKRVPDFYTASWVSTLSASILNEFRFGLKRDTWQGTSPLDKGCCWNGAGQNDRVDSAQKMVDSFPKVGGQFAYVRVTQTAPTLGGLFAVNQGMAYAPFGVASPRQSISPFKQFSDTFSFTKGAHSFQAGAEFDFASSHQFNHGGQQTTRPTVTMGAAAAIPVVGITGGTTGNFKGLQAADVTRAQTILANLAGSVQSITQQYFVNSPTAADWTDYRTSFLFQRDLHENDWDLFFKDNWKVSKNLTLNLGLRYDKYGVPYDTTGLGGRFNGGLSTTGGEASLFGCSGTSFAVMFNPNVGCDSTKLTTTEFVGKGSPNPGKTFWGNDWNNFSPSFGFSYSVPWLKRTTVIRGGYGINYAGAADYLSYSGNIGNLPGQTLNASAPISTYVDLSTLASSGLIPVSTGGAQPFTAVPMTNRTAGITGYADKRVTPYVQSFNLNVQHEIARNLTLDVSWIANKATKLFSSTQLNDTNIFSNGFLDAFNTVRAGGTSPLMDKLFPGGSAALRTNTTTNVFLANGDVGALANYFNVTPTPGVSGAVAGDMLRRAVLPENFFVVNPQFGSVTLEGNNSSSTYHSFQSVLTRRLSSGVYSQFSYTFSKALGDNQGGLLTNLRDQRNRQLNKGILNIDRTHIIKANGTWDLPFGPNRAFLANAPTVVRRVVEGWQLSSVFSWVSGEPLTFTTGTPAAGITSPGTVGYRTTNTADLVGKLPADLGKVVKGATIVQYFSNLVALDPAKGSPYPDFGTVQANIDVLRGRYTNQVITDASGNIILQTPVPGTTGNTAVNFPGLRGAGNLGLDMALSKRVRIDETKSFTIRADAVNVLNRPIWGNPTTNINSANFGRITTATGNRTITFNARVDF
jgi:hypothetical protein